MADCNSCGRPLATARNPVCPKCTTELSIKKMLTLLPDESDREWSELTEWEQQFLPSVRTQFERKGTITENQYQALERIYLRLR